MWRIKCFYHNGKELFAPYKRVKFLFFHWWEPVCVCEYFELDDYIKHDSYDSYDSFFYGNCIGFYTEDDAKRYIKLYEDHCKLVEKTSKIKPKYIYPEDEPDGKRTDKD